MLVFRASFQQLALLLFWLLQQGKTTASNKERKCNLMEAKPHRVENAKCYSLKCKISAKPNPPQQLPDQTWQTIAKMRLNHQLGLRSLSSLLVPSSEIDTHISSGN